MSYLLRTSYSASDSVRDVKQNPKLRKWSTYTFANTITVNYILTVILLPSLRLLEGLQFLVALSLTLHFLYNK